MTGFDIDKAKMMRYIEALLERHRGKPLSVSRGVLSRATDIPIDRVFDILGDTEIPSCVRLIGGVDSFMLIPSRY